MKSLCGAGDSIDWWRARNSESITPALEAVIAVEKREQSLGSKCDITWIKTEKIYEMRVRFFKELAVRIAEMVSSKTQIWDKEAEGDNKFRDAKWKDFAVLVPTRTVYPVLERAFDEVGIPYALCTSKEYFARGEVADVINLISLLAQPNNPYYLVGWLASPFSGVEPNVVDDCINAAYLSQHKKEPIKLAETVQKIMPDIWMQITRLKAIAELRGVSDMIFEIMRSQEYLKAYDCYNRSKINANIVRLAELAYEYESSQGRSLVGCANYMQFAVTTAKQKEEPEVTDEEQDVVQVLTIHASKGLEYPIVALCGVENESKKTSGISASEKYGVIVQKLPKFLIDENIKNENTVAGIWHSEIEDEREREEKERLWYVAATRARDKLILCGTVNCDPEGNTIKSPKAQSFLGQIFAAAAIKLPERISEDKNLLTSTVTKTELMHVSWLTRENEVRKKINLSLENLKESEALKLKIASSVSLGRLSASAYAMITWCPNAYRIVYRQGKDMQWSTKSGEDIGGAEFGNLTHWVLARWNFNQKSISDYLPDVKEENFKKVKGQLPFELHNEFDSDNSRKKLRELLFNFAKSAEGKELAELSKNKDILHRETPFRVQDNKLLMVGATDIFWTDDYAMHIRDWKTSDEEFAPFEYYNAQLNFYAYAIWRYRLEKNIFDSKLPITVGLIYLNGSNPKIRYLKEVDLQKIGCHVHSMSTKAVSGIFEKTLSRCNVCPWKNECGK